MTTKVVLNPFVLRFDKSKKNPGLRILLSPVKEAKKAEVEFFVNNVIR